jgi:hypothetical protein
MIDVPQVAPGAHHDVKRTLHRMLLDGFAANDLEIPHPKSIGVPFEPRPRAARDA